MTSSLKYLVLDTETTGILPSDRIVEVAAVLIQDGRILKSYSTLVKPQMLIPPQATAIHHITNEDVLLAPLYQDILPNLNALVSEVDILVAHHASFDRRMLRDLAVKPWLCTLQMARRAWPGLVSYKNERLRELLNLDCPETKETTPHRALHDAYVTSYILRERLKTATSKTVAGVLEELIPKGRSSKTYVTDSSPLDKTKVGFGLFRELTYSELWNTQREYCHQLVKRYDSEKSSQSAEKLLYDQLKPLIVE